MSWSLRVISYVLATPSIYVARCNRKNDLRLRRKLFVSAIKGIVPKHNECGSALFMFLKLASEVKR